MPDTAAFICMGSNMGAAPLRLAEAVAAVNALSGVTVRASSSVYRTEPQDNTAQPWFHNQVLEAACAFGVTADSLLEALLEIETRMGRERDETDRFGPRVIDLDLLIFGDEIRADSPRLILPHPRMERRAFVLVPLHEIAPDLILPDGRSLDGLLRKIPHRVEGDRIYQ